MKSTLLIGFAGAGCLLLAYAGCRTMLAHGRKGEAAGFLGLIVWSVYMGLAKLNDWPGLTLINLQQTVVNPAADWIMDLIQ